MKKSTYRSACIALLLISASLAQGELLSRYCKHLLKSELTQEQVSQFFLQIYSPLYHFRTLIRDPLLNDKILDEVLAENQVTLNQVLSKPENYESIALKYYKRHLDFYHDDLDIKPLREESLLRQLKRHGAAIPEGTSGYAALREISANNLKTYLQKQALPADLSSEILEASKNIEIYFGHNSVRMIRYTGVPLLSSYRFSQMGVPVGNNTYEFNQKFMESDDNVFFNVHLRTKKKTRSLNYPKGQNEYGKLRAVLPYSSFATENAWISLFVMYEDDLYPARLRVDHLFRRWISATAVRNTLHRYDFTVDDFLKFIRFQLMITLTRLKTEDAHRYETLMTTLNQSNRDLEFLFDRLFKEEGFPVRYELKVPVSVPADELVWLY